VYGKFHISGGKILVVFPYIRFVHLLSKIVVGTSKTAVENTGKGRLGVTGIGAQMLGAIS
jgi:hypothetical protein